jgi:diguanylate cyclase (GGDEF)-like protein
MHKQIRVLIGLFAGTGTGYIYMGYLYSPTFCIEFGWYVALLGVSFWGYTLHRTYIKEEMDTHKKERWLKQLQVFLFIYFSMWTVMFVVYMVRPGLQLHYVAIATQLGVVVVSATILASQKKLATLTLVTLMLPLTVYFILMGEAFSYLLAFFTVVLGGVLLYAAHNTFSYLIKSQYQAYHDYLTSLGNRRYFIELLENAMKMQKHEKKHLYLLLIDLDHFKTINDSLGHDVGDALLREVSARMSLLSQKYKNTVSRLGGDEFCVLSELYESKEACFTAANHCANKLLAGIKESYVIGEHHLYISASIGVSIISNPELSATVFIKEADIAMYEAKTQGRNGIIFFNDALSKRVERKLEIERFLHFSLKNKEITLNYQPQVTLEGKIIGCEVLARWQNDKLGAVSPAEFIPIFEKTGFIVELGYEVLKASFETLKAWEEKGIVLQQFSVNISMRQMFHPSFVSDVKQLCQTYLSKEQCAKLIFEITENSVAEDVKLLIMNMNRLQEYGIRFSMDDFGTGYSSLSYLRQLPLDEIKIDKSFIAALDHPNQADKGFIDTIFAIARNLKLRVVAEGIETLEQQHYLQGQDCDILQGYYFSKPLGKEAFEDFFFEVSPSHV